MLALLRPLWLRSSGDMVSDDTPHTAHSIKEPKPSVLQLECKIVDCEPGGILQTIATIQRDHEVICEL